MGVCKKVTLEREDKVKLIVGRLKVKGVVAMLVLVTLRDGMM